MFGISTEFAILWKGTCLNRHLKQCLFCISCGVVLEHIVYVINEEPTQVSAHQENVGLKNRMWGISSMQRQYSNQRKSGFLRTLLILACKPTSHLKRLITQKSNFPLVLWRRVTPSLIHRNQEWNALVEGENGNHILSSQVY